MMYVVIICKLAEGYGIYLFFPTLKFFPYVKYVTSKPKNALPHFVPF